MGKKVHYEYNKDLPVPTDYSAIDFENCVVKAFLPVLKKGIMNSARKESPCNGVKKSLISIPVRNDKEIGCYVLEPENCSEKLPFLYWCHGGGFMIPISDSTIRNAGYYAKNANCRVFIPEYRLAPKCVYPLPFEDCYDSFLYLYNHAERFLIDTEKTIVLGDSAGGCLAACVLLACRDQKHPIAQGQILIYPVLDNTSNYPSMEEYEFAAWPKLANQQMWRLYMKKGDFNHIGYAVPMKHGNYINLPSTYIEPQEMDCLRDEAIEYAKKLQNAGVDVEVNIIPASYHGFDAATENTLVEKVLAKRCQVMKKMFGNEECN